LRLNARLIRSEHRDGYRTGHADNTAARAPRDTWRQRRHGVRGCARVPLGCGKTWCSARRQEPASVELGTWRRAPSMRRRPSDAPRSPTPSRSATSRRPPTSQYRCRLVVFPAKRDTRSERPRRGSARGRLLRSETASSLLQLTPPLDAAPKTRFVPVTMRQRAHRRRLDVVVGWRQDGGAQADGMRSGVAAFGRDSR
jgi:hypothetical protein